MSETTGPDLNTPTARGLYEAVVALSPAIGERLAELARLATVTGASTGDAAAVRHALLVDLEREAPTPMRPAWMTGPCRCCGERPDGEGVVQHVYQCRYDLWPSPGLRPPWPLVPRQRRAS